MDEERQHETVDKSEELGIVVPANRVHSPHTVVVELGDTHIADAAVFASKGFQNLRMVRGGLQNFMRAM